MLQIVDILYQNDFDPVKEKANGMSGMIVKIGQGAWPEYLANKCTHIEKAKAAGMPWGTYWLVDSRISPEQQKACIKQWYPTGDFGPLGLWLDVEKPRIDMKDADYQKTPYAYYKTVESVWRGIYAFYGFYPGIYSGPGAWNLVCGGMPVPLQQEFADKSRLWTAQYNGSMNYDLYGKWTKATLRQWREGPDYNYVLDEEWFAQATKNTKIDSAPQNEPAPQVKTISYVTIHYNDGSQMDVK